MCTVKQYHNPQKNINQNYSKCTLYWAVLINFVIIFLFLIQLTFNIISNKKPKSYVKVFKLKNSIVGLLTWFLWNNCFDVLFGWRHVNQYQ